MLSTASLWKMSRYDDAQTVRAQARSKQKYDGSRSLHAQNHVLQVGIETHITFSEQEAST